MARKAKLTRKTHETDIRLELDLDGTGASKVMTSIGFFDHMLTLLARHSGFDLDVKASGDTHVDYHHTVEDVGIVLGQVLRDALGDKAGIERYGSAALPMDETLARVAIDLGGRPYLVFNVEFPSEKVGDFDTGLVEEFMRAVATNAMMNLHIEVPHGANAHHISEAVFKGLARALRQAVKITGTEIPSTKGQL
ncbi:MAG: imidazoleglycerol-phosphate dehydratase HisB [Planctomycetes bacterium]|nr:imidazoleglycerol-phosphate dehydratase HisB [Planctomycetota bacterium]